MSMAMMVAMASRQKRDEDGRSMEGGNNRRMEGDYYRPEGNYSMTYDDMEMRRRRDSRGRYMERDGGSRMEYGGTQDNYDRMEDEPEMRRRRDSRGRYMIAEPYGHYMPWPEPHIPPYLEHPGMAEERNLRPGRERRAEYDAENEMAMEGRYPMRDRNIVNIRDYQDRRKIGFGESRMHAWDGAEKEAEPIYGHESMHGEYPMIEKLTEESATEWVNNLKNTDPEYPVGAKWSRETIKPLAMKHGFTTPEKQLEFWVVMNMMYSDYAETAKKHGVSTMDFFADMAKAWMKDKDAVEDKTAAYIACCTK